MHPLNQKLREIMERKKTRLAVSADVTKAEDLVRLAEETGEHVCIFKTHIDIVEDFSPALTNRLQEIAREKDFLIFEDRKFADIGNTVKNQFTGGVYKIADWADIVNAHPIVGPGIVEGLAAANKKSALLLLAQMTPKGNLFTKDYALKSAEMAKKYPDFVIGFIGSADMPENLQALREAAGDELLIMTPGVQIGATGDALGQSYVTPGRARELGADIVIVGRGITHASDRKEAARLYREASY